ncbi:hypothetical protein [Siminovitchia sp. FSL W7-1587]|uniref:prenyltransferase/squalene oxidase repeat-containing protein n=1 Tax=Siminovitchia sp. FSL W7-1587 TaxID=2954699 RepID=UPI0030CC1BEA
MQNNYVSRIVTVFIISVVTVVTMAASADAETPPVEPEALLEDIERVINWKKGSIGLSAGDPLLNNPFLENAGDTTGDWYPIGIGRIGYPDDYEAYLAVIGDTVTQRYQQKNKLSDSKATEWHRISLAILAMGGDPTQIGKDEKGQPINLIADGTYDRGKTKSLGKQGINGWIWGLITLDSMRYKVPKDASADRNDMIQAILRMQLPDGGFSLHGPQTDPDMTAMALQALAPYYNSEQVYTYEQKAAEEKVTKTVRQAVDEAIETLSTLQLDDGGYASQEAENVESIAQVIVALTALGIDPLQDERFIKNGNTLLDGLKKYQLNDGGFIHSETYDPENPSSLPNESNPMASEQALYALVALYRYYGDYRTLYDFRSEMDAPLKKQIHSVQHSIENLPEPVSNKDREKVKEIFSSYLKIPIAERSYVFNYAKLADAMNSLQIENTSERIAENIGETKSGNGTITPLFNQNAEVFSPAIFTKEEEDQAKKLPQKVTTEHYVEVVKLLEKLEAAENRNEYEHLLDDLHDKKAAIEKIKAEIEALNKDILDKLYPFHQLSIKDKDHVEDIVARYEQLSTYDKQKILSYEDVEKSKTQIDNLIRARMISIAIGIILVVATMVFIWRRRKRKLEKLKQKMLVTDENM